MSAIYDTESKYFPYGKVQNSFYDLSQMPTLPKQICDYLLDAPNPLRGYTPKDDNTYPRCRLWKYLYYDAETPLENALPTIQQKLSVYFDPKNPENPPTDKGYRLIPQSFVKPAQTDGQTTLRFYIGRMVPVNEFSACIAVNFLIWTHYQYEANMQTNELSRLAGIEQALVEALHGVNMTGVGTFFFDRKKHPECGSEPLYDGNTNIGRRVTLALEIATTESRSTSPFDNMPFMSPDGSVRI